MKLISLIFLILIVSGCATCAVPKLPIYNEPDYPIIDVEKEIHQTQIAGTQFYKISKDTLTKFIKKNAMRRNFILKLQAQIQAINNQ